MPDPIATAAPSIDRENPWPGLASFTEDARGFFFGREKETDELSRLVRRQTLTVLFGQSGLGKSSLIQAGLFPLLRETDHLPLYLRLDHDANRPPLADQVKAALTAAFVSEKADAPAFRADETLWEYFHRKDVDIWSAKNRLLTPVLAFDQFEEIFTLGRADDACSARSRAFLAELTCLVENRAPAAVQDKLDRGELDPARFNFSKPSCQVILSLREDFLPDLEGLKHEMPALVHNRLRLKKLSGTQALDIVTKPAPHLLAEGVAEKIVEFVAGARGGSAERLAELDVEPPLLSVICRELNDRRRARNQEKITADLVSGNRREILTDFYERSVADLPAGMRTFVEDHLLTKSGFRDNLALETALELPGVTRALVDALVARRLLRLEDRLGLQRVELTHDVLADVVRNARDARQQRAAVEEAQRRERLALEAAMRQTRRQRFAIAGLALAVIALCVGAVFGIRAQRRAATLAGETELATGTTLLDEGKTGDGLAYLAAAARRDQGHSVAATRIVSTLAARNFLLPVGSSLMLPSPATQALILADGRSVLVLGEDSRVRVIDLADWKVTREFSFGQKIQTQGVRVAANNPAVFAVALADGTVQVCDTATGRPRGKAIAPPNLVESYQIPLFQLGTWRTYFAFSPDGRWLTTFRGTTAVFDTATGEERFHGEHFNHTMPTDFLTFNPFSPDSSRLAIPFWELVGARGSGNDAKPVKSTSVLLSVPEGKVLVTRTFEDFRHADGAKNFSADGTRVLMLTYTGTGATKDDTNRTPAAKVCDARTLEPIGPPITFSSTNSSNEIFLTPDGNRVVFNLAGDRTAKIYDAKTGQLAYPELPHGATFTSIGISEDGAIYATNSIDGQIRLWDLRTGALFAEPTLKFDRRGAAALSRDGRTVLAFSTTGLAYRLDVTRGPAAPLVLPRPAGVGIAANFVEKAPARALYVTGTAATMLDVASGRKIDGGFALSQRILGISQRFFGTTLHSGDVWLVRTATAGRTIWTWGDGGAPRETTFAETFPTTSTPAPLLSPTGRIAAIGSQTGTGSSQSSVALWDLRTGRKITAITSGDVTLNTRTDSTDVSPDDQRFVVRELMEDGALRVYGVRDGKLLFQLTPDAGATFRTARFNRDGSRLLTGNAWGTLQIWDGVSGRPLQSIQAHSYGLERIDFSADGRYYATGSADGTAQVREAPTNEPVGAPLNHTAEVNRIQFSTDSSRVLTSTVAGAVRAWDLRTGLPLGDSIKHPTGATPNLDFSDDGRFLMTYYSSGTERATRIWTAPPTGPARPAPSCLLRLATICAGRRLNESAKIVSALDEFDRFAELRREIGALPDDAPYAAWAKWFLSADPARSIAPGFTVTPADAKKLADELAKATPAVPSSAPPAPASAPKR